MKEHIEKFKELWANKRIRAAIILGFYALFFIFLSVALNSSSQVVTSTDITDYKSYNYTITIESDETFIVTGSKLNEEQIVIINNKQYCLTKTCDSITSSYELYNYKNFDIGVDLQGLTDDKIKEYLNEATKLSNENIKVYEITINDFYLIYDMTYKNNKNIMNITVKEDYNNTQLVIDNTYENIKITINYNNIIK